MQFLNNFRLAFLSFILESSTLELAEEKGHILALWRVAVAEAFTPSAMDIGLAWLLKCLGRLDEDTSSFPHDIVKSFFQKMCIWCEANVRLMSVKFVEVMYMDWFALR